VSQRIVTTVFPGPSSRATSSAILTEAPAEMPTSSPSRRASSSLVRWASASEMVRTSLSTERSRMPGTNPAPMPSIRCSPGGPPDRTALLSGSTATMRTSGRLARSTRPTPVMVPPVPTPWMNASGTRLPSWARISGPVVLTWASTLAGLLNCWGMKACGLPAQISAARSTAPFMTWAAGVRCSSAPYARRSARRSSDMLSGIVRMRR